MMLPSTIHTQAAVATVAARRGWGKVAPLLFSAGTISVAAFGLVAFIGDYAVHSLVERTPYLHSHELIVMGAVVLWPVSISSRR
jgi:predicted metal-binding membrane protein